MSLRALTFAIAALHSLAAFPAYALPVYALPVYTCLT
jgi:hypothetical protein